MSFGRFVWLLQRKHLWLSWADLLGDPWKISLAGNQLEFVISRHPIGDIFSKKPHEGAIERSARIIKAWRRHTFVNCRSAAHHESHALWRIYCPHPEGVAIQTTLAKLQQSVGALAVYRVTYEVPGPSRRTPTHADLVTKKRPVFAYEQEVRVVSFEEDRLAEVEDEKVRGRCLSWDPEMYVESIRVHPQADDSFFETVMAVVEQYAPSLEGCVARSDMNAPPPF